MQKALAACSIKLIIRNGLINQVSNRQYMSAPALSWNLRADKLPQPGQQVLVYVPAAWQQITVAAFKIPTTAGAKHMFVAPDRNGVNRYIKGVTHWMPLPEPPADKS
ncbi:DUF551 domain-containing protein [Hymenobacter volaticus]|uniref:DUF551 domain-containing protein n=1 Tax=Hymenobacter volaticus TaxID=2932254 RepID=UPI001FD66545|nr:DUF551 domain-containing protein [Hymenobacter volaticus]